MPDLCWLHPEGDEQPVTTVLVGVRTDKDGVVPADRQCAIDRGHEAWIVDADQITVCGVRP